MRSRRTHYAAEKACDRGHCFQIGTDAVATADLTVALEVAFASLSMQLPEDSGLQHLSHEYGIRSCDRFFTRTIILCDANRIVSSRRSMAWIQTTIMLKGNFKDFNVVPK